MCCVSKNVMMVNWEELICAIKNGQPVTATDEFHMRKFDDLAKDNWQNAPTEIAVKCGISQERASHVIDVFQHRKILKMSFLNADSRRESVRS